MLIKICGMKEPGNVKEVAALHPDMLGFIFYKASQSYAGDLSPRDLERLPAAIGKVGVFVNAETGFIENIVRRYKNCMGMNPLKWVTILYGKATG